MTVNLTPTTVSARGWQSGISSLVRFAAMIPASFAVVSASPFGRAPRRPAVSGAIEHGAAGDRTASRERLRADVHRHDRAVGCDVREVRHARIVLGTEPNPYALRCAPAQAGRSARVTWTIRRVFPSRRTVNGTFSPTRCSATARETSCALAIGVVPIRMITSPPSDT